MIGLWYLQWVMDEPEGEHFNGVRHPDVGASSYVRLFKPQGLADDALIYYYRDVLGFCIEPDCPRF